MKISFPEYHLFQFLKRFEQQHLPLDLALSFYFKQHKALGSKDRQFIAEAVYGMSRWKSLLDYLIESPASWEKRYAIFTHFKPKNYLHNNHIPLHIRLSFPEELISEMIKNFGQPQTVQLCEICNEEAPITIRINPLKTDRESLLKKISQNDEATFCLHSPFGIHFKKRKPLFALPEFKLGLFEIQDEASQIAASLVKCQTGQHVLDYCAGSGGKTLAFAYLLQNSGQIYLHDIRPHILEQAKKRLKRAGIQNYQLLNNKNRALKNKMDWILIDAPCSGTGTLRRNPDQKWKFSSAMLEQLVQEQRAIFKQALEYLKPDGHLVYATCSFLKAENENQVDYFCKEYNLEIAAPPFASLPTPGGMDGFFAVTLCKARERPGFAK